MKNRNSLLRVALPVILVFGALGFFGYTFFADYTPSDAQHRMDTHNKMSMGKNAKPAQQSPNKNEQGYYTVGKYLVRVEIMDSAHKAMPDEPSFVDDSKMMRDNANTGERKAVPKKAAMVAGPNRLQVSVKDTHGDPVNGATVRVAAQRESSMGKKGDAMLQDTDRMQGNRGDALPPHHSAVVQFHPAGQGIYRGELELQAQGDYALAVDISTESKGHGDLVLSFTTGEDGLRAATATPEGIAYYTCSMHTSVRNAGPGQCPICSMDLVPVTKEEVQSGVITVDARRRQLIGVETGTAVMRDLTKAIRAVGRVGYNERAISNVSLKFDAWIGDLKADYVGTTVERGQMLFTVYSPELLSAQQEYLESHQRLSKRDANDSLVRAARKRLMLWDISAAQVRALERRGQPIEYLPIFAPKSGTVVEKMVVEGSHMKTGDTLLRIADLSTVWVDAEIYESELPLVEKGMAATVTLPYVNSDPLHATVDYIYPYLDRATRTARIRVVLDNAQDKLKPDMYAEVHLLAELGKRLVVPEEAVLIAGESRVVFKDMNNGGEDAGKLKPVHVKTGQNVDGWIEITQGLNPGDKVITSGNFLIAAEAKLKTGINQW